MMGRAPRQTIPLELESAIVLACYFDIGGNGKEAPHRVACSSVYIGHEDDRRIFNRHWQHLLLKYELASFRLESFKQVARKRRWDAAKQHVILLDFANAAEGRDLLGLVVAVDTGAWHGIEARRRRRLGTSQEFCFHRLARLVIDRLEALKLSEPISLVFDRELGLMSRKSRIVQQMFRNDSRAETCVASTRFTDPTRCHELQAAQLLTFMAVKDLTEQSAGRLHAPAWLKTQTGLPGPSSESICEFWDKAFMDRYLAAVEWDAPLADDRPVRRRRA